MMKDIFMSYRFEWDEQAMGSGSRGDETSSGLVKSQKNSKQDCDKIKENS